MNKLRLLGAVCTVLCGLITVATQPAFALSLQTDATRDTNSGTASDPQGPTTTGSLFSEVLDSNGFDINFSGPAYARGAADDTGELLSKLVFSQLNQAAT